MSMETLKSEISTLPHDDLLALNDFVWSVAKSQQRAAVRNFVVGEKVEWDGRGNMRMEGTVKKLNQTTVSVLTISGGWKVTSTKLRKVG